VVWCTARLGYKLYHFLSLVSHRPLGKENTGIFLSLKKSEKAEKKDFQKKRKPQTLFRMKNAMDLPAFFFR